MKDQRTITKVPTTIKTAPTAVFKVRVSFKNRTDKAMVKATLSLSTGATFEHLPAVVL